MVATLIGKYIIHAHDCEINFAAAAALMAVHDEKRHLGGQVQFLSAAAVVVQSWMHVRSAKTHIYV